MATSAGDVGLIVLAVIAVVVIVVGAIWLAKKGYFEPSTNEETIEEREELRESIGEQDFRIPYRRRVGSWSLPYKVFAGTIVLLALGLGVATYQVLKTGSPVQQFVSAEIRYVIISVVGIAGGVYLKGWFDDQIGYLNVTYERAGESNLVERIPYAKTRVSRRDGEVTVPEIAPSRLLGLFWRYRQVGEDRRLRGTDKPLDDVIQHRVPPHGDELPDGSGFDITTNADGDVVLAGATSTADVTYGSPNSLSAERAIQYRQQKNRALARLKAIQATNAELNRQINKMRKMIENEEYEDRKSLLDDFGEIADMLSTLNVRLSDQTRNGESSSGGSSGSGKEEASAK